MLLAGSMVLSNVDERLSNVDEPKILTMVRVHLQNYVLAGAP